MTKIWVFDCEGDSLTPTKLHCLAAGNPKSAKVHVTSQYNKMRKLLTEADILVGHNITRFDIPTLERLLDIKIKAKLVDTLALSWYLYPNRPRHGLESWGEYYGRPKPVITDWVNQTQEEYEHRCSEDVEINIRLWNDMYQYLLDLYGSNEEIWRLLDYLALKMHCARLQEESQWKLDVEQTRTALAELEKIKEEKVTALQAAMPKVPTIQVKSRPKRFINIDGTYSKLGMEWIKLLSEKGLPPDYEGEVEIIKGYEDGNPNSSDQLKNWLYSLGWKPRTFKHTKNKTTGETKDIPQINLDQGKGICPSIIALYEVEPSLELLEGLSVLSHRIGILKGFLRDQEDGWIKAQIKGFTNTLRFQHTTVVNLPKVGKLFADPIRSALTAPEDHELCGSDMASLEDRIKQHFIFPHDPEYVHSMNQPDFDPHLIIAGIAKMLTQEEIQAYKNGDKKHKPVRDIAKNGNYACQYGAGIPRLMITCGIDRTAATALFNAYWELNWAIKAVVGEQTVKMRGDQMWLFNPVSKLWYSLRYEKDIFSTLVQGTASYVFDLWVKKVLDKRPQLTAQFHDEIVLCVKKGHREACEKLLRDAIAELNTELNLNRELGIDVQFGDRYSDIH